MILRFTQLTLPVFFILMVQIAFAEPVPTIRTLAYWRSTPTPQLSQRIHSAPHAMVDYLRKENADAGYTEVPVSASPMPEVKKAFEQIEQILPHNILALAENFLAGVFIVNDLGSTGYSETILDDQGREVKAFIVLDQRALKARTANQWATWRETSFFTQSPEAGATVTQTLEYPQNDTVTQAVSYILLHELGHVLGVASKAHPSWEDRTWAPRDYPFTALSWVSMQSGKSISRFDNIMPNRRRVRFYRFQRASLTSKDIPALYQGLAQSNFPSMYGAINPYDDFAESFASYAHTILAGRPFATSVSYNSTTLGVDACWNTPRCKAKQRFMEQWFATAH